MTGAIAAGLGVFAIVSMGEWDATVVALSLAIIALGVGQK